MGKKALLILIAAIIAVLLWWNTRPETKRTPDNLKTPTTARKARIQSLYQGPRAPIKPVKEDTRISPACLELWKQTRALDLRGLFEYPPRISKISLGRDCKNLPGIHQKLHDAFQKECAHFAKNAQSTSEEDWNKVNGNCFAALGFYRASMTAWLTEHIPPESIEDPQVLIDRLFTSMMDTSDMENGARNTEKLALRLLELEPEIYGAAQALHTSRIFQAIMDEERSPEDPIWQKVAEARERKRTMRPDDAEAHLSDELFQSFMQNKDSSQLHDRASSALEQFPNSPSAHHFLAVAEYRMGNPERALELKRQELRLRKDKKAKDSVKEQIERIKKREERPFAQTFGYELDFYQSE